MCGLVGGCGYGFPGAFFLGGLIPLLLMLIFWILVIIAGYYIYKSLKSTGKINIPNIGTSDSAVEILRQRYAKGEIEKAEYDRRMADLTGKNNPPPPPPPPPSPPNPQKQENQQS